MPRRVCSPIVRKRTPSTGPRAASLVAPETMIYRDECGRQLRAMAPQSLPALTAGSPVDPDRIALRDRRSRITRSLIATAVTKQRGQLSSRNHRHESRRRPRPHLTRCLRGSRALLTGRSVAQATNVGSLRYGRASSRSLRAAGVCADHNVLSCAVMNLTGTIPYFGRGQQPLARARGPLASNLTWLVGERAGRGPRR
jgi:hypothetical protein